MRIDSRSFVIPTPPASRATGRELVAVQPPQLPTRIGSAGSVNAVAPPASRLRETAGNTDIRHASPRDMLDLSLDLHLAGYLDWDEYAMVAFQPELHPDFDKTIGALTGIHASPDRPRDQLGQWEERLAFEHRYPAADTKIRERTERIVAVFRQLDLPISVVA